MAQKLRSTVRSEELGQRGRQVDEVDRFSDVVTEACFNALVLDIGHDVCRERDDGHVLVLVVFFPVSDLRTRLVAIFARHVEVTLGNC